MSKPSLESDFHSFVEFATNRIERGESAESIEGLLQQWRAQSEYDQTVADIRQGMADDAQGLSEPAAKVFSDIRSQLGISE